VAPEVVADRSVGAVLAAAAGDALGAGYEFGPPLAADAPVGMVGGGAFGWAPGEWTDDTQMALGILGELAGGRTGTAGIEAAFRAWFASGPADVGIQTSVVLSDPRPLAEAVADYAARHPDSSAGNGSLMRTGPVALAHPGDPPAIATTAREISLLTHADPDCPDACVLWSVAIDHTIHHAPDSSERWDWCEPLRVALDQLDPARRDRWARRIDEAATAPPTAFPKNGWVVHAFQAALAAICCTPVPAGPAPARHLVHTLGAAVRAGGDTDTVAAIAGAMVGARWGATAVPLRWRRILHGRTPRAGEVLRAGDLDRLARLAADVGRPGPRDRSGRPSATEPDRPPDAASPVRAEFGGVAFGDAAALPAAVDDGVEVVVSLGPDDRVDVLAGVEHHVLGLVDGDRSRNPNAALLLADTADTLAAWVAEQRRVFVHGAAARNRVAALAVTWLERHLGHPADEALVMVGRVLGEPHGFLREAAVAAASIVPMDPLDGG
jgi:ADP-ribosylglycohydrolase